MTWTEEDRLVNGLIERGVLAYGASSPRKDWSVWIKELRKLAEELDGMAFWPAIRVVLGILQQTRAGGEGEAAAHLYCAFTPWMRRNRQKILDNAGTFKFLTGPLDSPPTM